MAAPASTLPRWNFDDLYPSLDSPVFTEYFEDVIRQVDGVAALFDRYRIGADAEIPAGELPGVFTEVVTAYNSALDDLETLIGSLYATVSVDTNDTTAMARLSELQVRSLPLGKLSPRFSAWVGTLDVDALVAASPLAAAHEFALRRAKVESEHLMEPAQEDLAADLHLSGGTGWEKLHGTWTSQLEVPFVLDGEEVMLPLSRLRALSEHRDRDVRRRAWEAETRLWEGSALPVTAALNGVKGETITLTGRRGWNDVIDYALHISAIDREVLDAMMGAAEESFPMFRRYLQARARRLGTEKLAFYDLEAPLGESSTEWPWANATAYIEEQFDRYSTKMGDLARRAFTEPWIDAEPRAGKVDGAYCMWLNADQSRIMANYEPAYGGVITLAHELGHAYHNLCMRERTPLQRQLPMTLAETASTFCETLVRDGALQGASDADALLILDGFLQSACAVVVDISSRYKFEQGVIDQRRERELSTEELCGLMRQAQLDTYGDGLDPEALHPWNWAPKPHYYATDWPFYNYPYMFGLLFGLGLYARYQAEPDGFHEAYDELLSRSGMGTARELAAGFGIDLADRQFWADSLALVGRDIDRCIELMERVPKGA